MKFFYNSLSFRGKRFFIGFAFIFLSLLTIQIAELLWHYWQTAVVRYQAVALSYNNVLSDFDVLIVGDSTGVGAGASRPEESVAGRFIGDGASVLNLSHSGDKTYEVLEQVRSVKDRRFDLVLLFTGANDILWFKNSNETSYVLRELVRESKKISDKVVLVPPGNVGLAPIFDEPIGVFYERRTRDFREKFMRVALEENIIYIDTFSDSLEDLFQGESRQYFATDLLHPSSKGYELWYKKILEKI